jgi:acyl-CoA synthetase (AMP-forming)/AMP-acid ligase II
MTVDDVARNCDPDEHPPRRPAATSALLQFTSGSSGQARGVRVPFDALAANIAAIRRWLAMTEDDPTASWLPLHHDMGLIGCLITPVVNQSDLWLLEPERFVRNPVRYVQCFDAPGARLTAIPPFGLDYITRRISPHTLEGLDFSEWRAVIVGSERIDPAVLRRFTDLVAPFGFDRRALLPAYGLAEATLAVSGLALNDEVTTVAVHSTALAVGECITSRDDSEAGDDVQQVVGCGTALAGLTIDIVDDAGTALPDGHLGQIVVRGTSIAAEREEYEGSDSLTRWHDGALHTGDAGFTIDGQLFVIGRLGDSMKIRGRTIFAEDIEAALVAAGVPRTRLAVLLGASPRGATAVVLIEQAEGSWLNTAQAVLRRTTEGAAGLVVDVPRKSIQRTTSGKPKRRPMWQAFAEGRIAGAGVDVALPLVIQRS